MAFLTQEEFKKSFGASREDVKQWLKDKKLPYTRPNRALANRRIVASKIRKTIGKDVASLESAGAWQIIYGETKVGGTITFAHITNNNRDLHLVITLAGHEIEGVQKLYLDDQEVIFGASPDPRWSTSIYDPKTGQSRTADHKVFMEVNDGAIGNPAIADLISTCPDKWTSLHKQFNRAHVYLIIRWDAVLFPDAIPDISFLVRGKKCYNPVTDSTAWTQNPVLHVLDYLTSSEYGLGALLTECEITEDKAGSFFNHSEICDQSVATITGTENRFTGNGAFEIGTPLQSVIEELCTSFAGSISFSGGKFRVWTASYIAPTIYLDEDDILSDIKVNTRISRRDNFNAVKGTYISANTNYEETDFPAITNSYYENQDAGQRTYVDIQLPYTQSSSTAQRIAKIELERIRQPITVELTCTIKAYQVEAGETLYLSVSRFGWTNKIFLVEEIEPLFGLNGQELLLACKLILRETASAVYDWNSGEETRVDLAPNTTLPDAFTVQTPANIVLASGTAQLYIRSDGTIFSRLKVSWDALTDFFVSSGGQIEVQYKLASDSSWSIGSVIPADLDFTHILDVKDGESYNVRVRSKSAFGVYSEYSATQTHTVIGKTEKPSNVSGFASSISNFGIFFTWTKITDLDLSAYEIRYGDLDDSWEDSIVIDRIKSNGLQVDLLPASDYKYQIKAIDTSGNYSELATSIIVSIARPSAPTFTGVITATSIQLNWTASTGLFEIAEYEIRYGNTFSSATVEATIKGTSYARRIDWSGARKFWVVAKDVAGNYGYESFFDLAIQEPSQVNNLSVDIIDNNVFLKWQAPTSGSLPIDHYKVYKGAVFADADLVGQVNATFSALFEIISGTYTYWVKPYDTAGNAGTETAVIAIVSEPPDFVILDDQILTPSSGTGINIFIDGEDIYFGVLATQSWEGHFIANGWTSAQDQIDDLMPYYLQPTLDVAYWYKVIDQGAIIEASLIKVAFVKTDISGDQDIKTFIAYSDDGVTWTETEASQVYAQNFQYIRVKLALGTLTGESGALMGVLGITHP